MDVTNNPCIQYHKSSFSLCCPECEFSTTSTFDLRKHAMTAHLDSPGIHSFELQIFTCSVCGVSSTDHVQIKNHRTIHSREHKQDEQSIVMAQRIVLGSCDDDDFHCSSESDYECKEVQSNTSSDKKDRSSKAIPSTGSNDKSCSKLTYAMPSVSASSLVPSDSNSKSTISLKSDRHVSSKQPRVAWQDWSKLITRSDKKFICLVCRRFIYSGRTEVVFHTVTRHLLAKEIGHDLSQYGRLTEQLKRQIGRYFSDGMRIRSGVHYKDAKRVEAALFRSIELHLRYQPITANQNGPEKRTKFICSGCNASFTESQAAYAHVNEELRAFLPEFMRARSCPWSLSTREEWVWTVPDLPVKSLPLKSLSAIDNSTESNDHSINNSEPHTPVIHSDRVHKKEQPDHNSSQCLRVSTITTTPAVTITVNNCLSNINNNNNRIDNSECITIPTISPCSLTTVSGFLPVPIMSIHPVSTLSFTSPPLEFTSHTLQPSQSIIPISCILTSNPLS
uniref:Zinc finger, C2H2-type domain-containing protein n=1 Tax=Schistosoma japonicum TaxID=6182 RepID=C1LH14_SCHJA|nr:Zinc finger, C2H2-type domain-containing protein [Schistosoma japonicum]